MKDSAEPGLLDELAQELRGPLSAISDRVQSLHAGIEGHEREQALGGIAADVHAMALLLDRLQAAAAPLAGREIATVPLDIVAFLTDWLAAHGAETRLDAPGRAMRVLADPVWLKQMFSPFLSREQIGSPWPTKSISIASRGDMTEVVLETQKPHPSVMLLVRAITRSQGGECLNTASEDRSTLRFLLPTAP